MNPLEFTVDGEIFRVSERFQDDGRMSYDFAWLNGPADGTYGFTVGCSPLGARMTRGELMEAGRGFAASFYEPGGIGEEDFPEHVAPHPRSHM
ncbi:hypothetical protein [Nesterenkonia sp. CF4.4]|uniref:hypothetical protein n=1 Tax=Nesterenkonia sp. CF4.4 TaxID=3373079 RepID=UPI003EE7FBED